MLNGKIALITGGTRGIGRACALKLASLGADIALFYAGNELSREQTLEALKPMNVRAIAVRCDVSDYEQVKLAVDEVHTRLGPVDILVNNAGITRDKLALRMSGEDFTRVIDVNLNGAFYMIRATMSDFVRRRSGRIINITSISGLMGNAGQANYSAAKAGLVGLTKTIARELAPRGVTVNAIAPGFVKTDMTGAMDEETLSRALAAVPLARIGQPEDIASAVAFLAGDEASYITGTVLKVDGGMYM